MYAYLDPQRRSERHVAERTALTLYVPRVYRFISSRRFGNFDTALPTDKSIVGVLGVVVLGCWVVEVLGSTLLCQRTHA